MKEYEKSYVFWDVIYSRFGTLGKQRQRIVDKYLSPDTRVRYTADAEALPDSREVKCFLTKKIGDKASGVREETEVEIPRKVAELLKPP